MNKVKLKSFKKRYTLFTKAAYGHQSPKNAILFALLSVNTSYEKNAKAFEAMKNKDWFEFEPTLNELLKHGIHYAGSRARYINNAFYLLQNEPDFLQWFPKKESIQDFRDRLVKNIPGLSWIKVSFLISILYGDLADVCCLDRWMLRSLGSDKPEETMKKIGRYGKLPRKRYEEYESILRKEAQKIGLSLCAYQWAIWDLIQSGDRLRSNPMKALWAKEK